MRLEELSVDRYLGKTGNLNGGSSRMTISKNCRETNFMCISLHERELSTFGIDFVHGGEVVHILKEDIGFHNYDEHQIDGVRLSVHRSPTVFIRRTRCLEDLTEIFQRLELESKERSRILPRTYLTRLFLHTFAHKLTCLRIESKTSAQVQCLTHLHSLATIR